MEKVVGGAWGRRDGFCHGGIGGLRVSAYFGGSKGTSILGGLKDGKIETCKTLGF